MIESGLANLPFHFYRKKIQMFFVSDQVFDFTDYNGAFYPSWSSWSNGGYYPSRPQDIYPSGGYYPGS